MMRHIQNIEKMPNTCVAFGSFDGVHKGHLAAAAAVVAAGRKTGTTAVVVSCYSGKKAVTDKVLTTETEKAYHLGGTGVNVLISCDMDEESPNRETFVREVIIGKLGAGVIVVGAQNEDLELVKRVAAEAAVQVMEVTTVCWKEQAVTSDMVRKAVMECRFQDVNEMCGHPYTVIGEVVHGKALGRTVGMPTANLGVPDHKLKPDNGVYATMSDIDGELCQGMTNIGTRPSVDDMSYITIETFLFDFSRDIYGKTLALEVYLYIRGVKKFDNLEEVQEQVQKDIARVKDYLDAVKLGG